jgi:SpoVK/Ycf46/Vps4 family AAA+-type ATPase
MRLSEDKIRRLAERLHDEMAQRGLLEYRERAGLKLGAGRAERVKAIYDFIIADLLIEEEIEAEAEKVLATYSREIKGTERDIIFRKHKEEIARKRGYIL